MKFKILFTVKHDYNAICRNKFIFDIFIVLKTKMEINQKLFFYNSIQNLCFILTDLKVT